MILNIQQDNEENASSSQQNDKVLKGSWKKKHLHKKKLKTIQEKNEKLKSVGTQEESKEENKQDVKKSLQTNPQHHVVSQLWSQNSTPEFSGTKALELKPSVNPLMENASFKDLGIDDLICQHLKTKLSISQPTPIQSKVIPQFLNSKKDILMQAQTGSGKSLAFLLPVMNQLLQRKHLGRDSGTMGLILAPTRELASQLFGVLGSLAKLSAPGKHWIVPGLLIGGEKKKSEKARLRKGITLLVATPGRLLDHLKTTKAFQISNLEWIILDEADHLLELGFEESIVEILKIIRGKRTEGLPNPRVILCSATIQKNVKQLAELTMDKDPLFIYVSKKESKSIRLKEELQEISVPDQLVQSFAIVPAKVRLVSLIGLLRHVMSSQEESHVIVFVSCRDSVDFHYDLLCSTPSSYEKSNGAIYQNFSCGLVSPYIPGSKIYKLHGNMQQSDRIKSFEGFTKSSESNILLCTDVAARGLDLPNITDIIQYDAPADIKDYIHRIGRSGRMGKSGKSFLFLLPSEQEYTQVLSSHGLSVLEHNILPFLQTLDKGSNFEVAANNLQSKLETFILSNQATLEFAKKAFLSHLRAYATHASLERHIFHVKGLHLGHVAKSFGLREAPSLVKSDTPKKVSKPGIDLKRKAYSMMKSLAASEFGDGDLATLAKKRLKGKKLCVGETTDMRHGVKSIDNEDPEIIEKFKYLSKLLLDNKSTFTIELLDKSTTLLQLNLEFYTIWNYRKNAIPQIFKENLNDHLEKELEFTFSCLLKHPKSYWVWNHRLWVLESLDSRQFWLKELENVGKMLDLDVRNFHGWNYRRSLLEKLPDYPLIKEWEYSTEKIYQNFSNFSAWHYRSWLLSKLFKNDTQVILKELELVRNAIFTEPSDQAPWYYHRILLGKDDTCLDDEIWESELNTVKSLLELEPDCKWGLTTLIHITSYLKKELQLIPEVKQKLVLLDPKRRGLYSKS